MPKVKTLKFGELEFTHRPLTGYLVVLMSQDSIVMKEFYEAFAGFVNRFKLSKEPVTWQEIADQDSWDAFGDFIVEWRKVEDEGKSLEATSN